MYIVTFKSTYISHVYNLIIVNQDIIYNETCLSRILYISKSCITRTLNKVQMRKILNLNLTCINRTPVYSKHKFLSQGGSVQTGFTVLCSLQFITEFVNNSLFTENAGESTI